MDDKLVQVIRYKLQKRVRRLNSAKAAAFHSHLQHLFKFVDATPLLGSVCDSLLSQVSPDSVRLDLEAIAGGDWRPPPTEEHAAAVGHAVLKKFCDDENSIKLRELAYKLVGTAKDDAVFDVLRDQFLEPLYEYLDEHIDDQQAILHTLRRYKQRCEWFQKDNLRTVLQSDTQKGERNLAVDLYTFLHDQGIEFYIEPHSASGIVDLIAEQSGSDRVIADAKLFWPEKSKAEKYLLSAFHQAYTYARDFNEPCAYLVIFKLCPEEIRFLFPQSSSFFPSLSLNNKTIYFAVIDICDHEHTASKRGTLKTFDFTADQFVQQVEKEQAAQETTSETMPRNSEPVSLESSPSAGSE